MTLAMISRYSFLAIVWTLVELPLIAFDLDAFEKSSRKVAGTTTRIEREVKIAFKISQKLELKKLTQSILNRLQRSLKNSHFARLTQQPLQAEKRFRAFVFKDIYLDSANHLLLRNKAAYRLRYRWTSVESYVRHLFLPFVKGFYPTRCEIQFKGPYRLLDKSDQVEVKETRFEFRNESPPFNLSKNAPLPPWPEPEFLAHAKSGYFRSFKMTPAKALAELVRAVSKTRHLSLNPVLQIETIRDRIHILAPNPWGTGPNPDQIFIVTIDKSEIAPYKTRTKHPALLEIEIEPDRSTLVGIEAAIEIGSNLDSKQAKAIKDFSMKAKEAIFEDLEYLRRTVKEEFNESILAKSLPLDFKYSRAMGTLRRGPVINNHPPISVNLRKYDKNS